MEIEKEMQEILKQTQTAKGTAKTQKKEIVALKLSVTEQKTKQTEILKSFAEKVKKSKALQYMTANPEKWKLLKISYAGEQFKDNKNKVRVATCDGVVFQNIEKGFLKKITV